VDERVKGREMGNKIRNEGKKKLEMVQGRGEDGER